MSEENAPRAARALVAPDGRAARLRVDGARLRVMIAWRDGPEQWQSAFADHDAALAALDERVAALLRAGFALPPDAAALEDRAALRLAAAYDALGDRRGALIRADLSDERGARQAAVDQARAQRRDLAAGPDLFRDGWLARGAVAWLYDDDGVHSPLDLNHGCAALQAHAGPLIQLHARRFQAPDRLLRVLEARRLSSTLTHLLLRALSGPAAALIPWLAAPPAALQSVIVHGLEARAAQAAPARARGACLISLLDTLARTCPRLRHLALWHVDLSASLTLLCEHPLIARLESLDLWSLDGEAVPWRALARRRARLEHLRRLILPGHRRDPRRDAALRAWPAVVPASHDRAEVIGHDLVHAGWHRSMR